jgi:iron complex outermembrane receptor protein
MSNLRRYAKSAAVGLLPLQVCGLGAASAQTAMDGLNATTLEEVVVTAQHKLESSRDVPITINAFDANALRQANYNSLAEISQQTPGLFYSASTGQTNPLSLRGIGTNRFDSRIDPSVGTFVNEIYQPRFGQALSDLVDVKRIEVLKGPQGTLYGRNTTGGAINIITNQPTKDPEAGVKVEVGTKHLVNVNAFVSGPIAGPALTGRLAVGYYNRDGFMEDIVSGHTKSTTDKLVRGTLDYAPSDNATISLIAEYMTRRKDAFFFKITSTPTIFQSPTVTAPPLQAGRYNVAENFPGFYDLRQWNASIKASVDLEPFTLTAISAFQHVQGNYADDVDNTLLRIATVQVEEGTKAFSQELRVASRSGGPLTFGNALEWIGGVFYLDDKPKEFDGFLFGQDSVVALLGLRIPGVTLPITNLFISDLDKKSIAGFGQFTYHITDNFQLTAGGRWTHDEIHFTSVGAASVTGLPLIAHNYNTGGDFKWSSFDPKYTLSYSLDDRAGDRALLYASFAHGFKSGGVQNLPTTKAAAEIPFNPEHVKTTELGVKSTWLDRRLQLDAAAFYTKVADLQVQTLTTLPTGATITVTNNAGSSTIRGAELQVAAIPIERLRLSFAYSHLNAKYDVFRSGPNVYSGNRLNLSPENTINVAAVYTVPLVSRGELSLRADWYHSSEVFFTPQNLPSEAQPAYAVTNASVGWTDSSNKWHAAIWGKNLFSREYIIDIFQSHPGFGFQWSDKRTVGLSVERKF